MKLWPRIVSAIGQTMLMFCVSGAAVADIVTIDFDDGFAHRTSAEFAYSSLGLTMPTMRFHQASDPGAEPFPFVDDWGIVRDGGLPTPPGIPEDPDFVLPGIFEFSSPVDFLSIDVFFSRSGDESSWNLRAFDASLNEVAFQSATIPPGPDFRFSSLRVDAPGLISLVVLNRKLNFGVDTISFGPPPVGGSVTGLSLRFVVCRNVTTGASVHLFISEGENSWDCEAGGLDVLPGDTVIMIEAGIAE